MVSESALSELAGSRGAASGDNRPPRPANSTHSLCWTGLIPLLAWVVVVPVPADEPSASAAASASVTNS